MARIRTIKPEFAQSEDIGRLSRDARLLFVQLFTIVDDEGRSRAASKLIVGQLYPYDDDAPDLIEAWLAEIEDAGLIARYDVEGYRYLEICTWKKHQKIDHAAHSRLPAPPATKPSRAKKAVQKSHEKSSAEPREALAKPRDAFATKDENLASLSRDKREKLAPDMDRKGLDQDLSSSLRSDASGVAPKPNGAHTEKPKDELYRRAKNRLGGRAGGLVTTFIAAHDGNLTAALQHMREMDADARDNEHFRGMLASVNAARKRDGELSLRDRGEAW